MNNVLRSILHRPIAVTMVLIAIVTLGIIALGRIPVSLMPDIDVPCIVVQLPADGVSAQEIEQRMVTPMRQQLSQMSGLQSIETTSRTDVGMITMQFSPGTDMSLQFIEVNEKIDRAMSMMPKDMERPRVMKITATDLPAFYIDITGGKMVQTSRLVRNVIIKRIEQLPEVAMVDVSGTTGTQVTVIPDAMKMASLGLRNSDIERAISDNNIILEALSIRDGIYRYNIHFDSQVLSISDIENIYLNINGRLLQLKEICDIREETSKRKGIVTSNGKEAITMAVIKQSDARMSDLREDIAHLTEQLQKDYPELSFNVTRDQTQLLSYSVSNLGWNLVMGVIMASVVLFIFIGGWRLPMLVVISIPLSLILTILCFYMIGISLNVISLSGLILGVGMIVDNAIIVVDNIRQKGRDTDENILKSIKEVFMPMLTSVLTTCSVFIPLIFISGTAGALFYDQAMGVSIALFCSLFVASLVVPVYYCLLGNKTKSDNNRRSVTRILVRLYEKMLGYTMRHQKGAIASTILILTIAAVLYQFVHKERLPQIPHTDAIILVDWNVEIMPKENNFRLQNILKAAEKHIKANTVMAGGQDFLMSHTKNITGSEAVCYIKAESGEELDSAVATMKRYAANHYPKAKIERKPATNIFDMIFSTDEPTIQLRLVDVKGNRPTVCQTRNVTDSLRKRFPHLNVQPVSTEKCLKYTTDAELMAYYGVRYQNMYERLRELLGTNHIYDISSGGESVPIVVGENAHEAKTLLNNTITNNNGVEIPLSYLVKEEYGEDYRFLTTDGDGAYSAINIEKAKDRECDDVMDYVTSITNDDKRSELNSSFRGEYFSSRSMIKELSVVFIVAVLMLYFILAAQFESIVQPIIILLEVVVDVSLVIIALFFMGESINIMSMIGMVVMCGIVINDSILKIDNINKLRCNGLPLLHAIVEAGHRRLLPIVMTSLTTILAITPFLNRADMGSALQFPLSFTIIVGMLVGTLVSLFFVPMVYYIIYRKR